MKIICENPQKISLRQQLHPLVMEGLIAFPADEIDKDVSDPFEVPGKPVSEMVIEDRR